MQAVGWLVGCSVSQSVSWSANHLGFEPPLGLTTRCWWVVRPLRV